MSEFDAELACLARELRRVYCEQKATRMRQSSYKPDSRNDGSELWSKIATLCRDLGANPEDFIAAAFMYCSFSSGPFSRNLAGDAMRRWYEQYVNQCHDSGVVARTPSEYEIRDRLASLRNFLKNKFGTMDPSDPGVLDELRSPLFGKDALACVLLAGDDELVMDRHRDEVEELLNNRPDILRSLKEMGIPINLMLQ